jgi:hypothetical protein
MTTRLLKLLPAAVFFLMPAASMATIFAPAAGQTDSTAVPANDPSIQAWATGYQNYVIGAEVDTGFQTPQKSLGEPGNSDGSNQGVVFDIVSLGRNGSITMTFNRPIYNGSGFDFAIFENAFEDDFLELATVEVSSDGINFVKFPAFSLVPSPVGGFGSIDPRDVEQVAGKYRGGFGTPFDLEQLSGSPNLDLNSIRYIRLNDIVGDGSAPNDLTTASLAKWLGIAEADLPSILVDFANAAPPFIYDVYPTYGSAGFDLDAVGAMYVGSIPVEIDLRPWSTENWVGPESTGDIPVAVLTTRRVDGDSVNFDARDIDAASLRLGYGEAPIVSGPHQTDLDADGDQDVYFVFQTQSTGIACGDTEITLIGETTGAEPLNGVDFVKTPDCPTGGCHP